jgi:uncharacterized membrane protein YfcA
MDFNHIFIIVLVGLLIGLSKGGVGGPVPISLIAPLLSQIMPVSQAVGISLPVLIFADIFAMRAYWRQWDMKEIRALLPTAFIGIVVGARLLSVLPNEALRRILGVFALIIVGYILANNHLSRLKYVHRQWHSYIIGFISGFGSALANAGGPPLMGYLLLRKIAPIGFVGTFTLFFFAVNVLKIPSFLFEGIINPEALFSIIWVLPIIPFGVWLGRKIIVRMNPQLFQQIMLIALFLAGIYLLFGTPPKPAVNLLDFPCGEVFFCGV